jgi:hypothetical protein
VEEAKLRQRMAELAAVERARAELEAAAIHAEFDLRRCPTVAGSELRALAEFRAHVRAEAARLAARRTERAKAAAKQQAEMLAARQRCRLLERLRERRMVEWKAASDRELEAIAAESHLVKWGAARRRAL